ncbi:CTP synthase [Mycoplasma sp. (ex Biomphalaria glabrata)]|uniref:CTP synthase n=1 Tax=Mycoplasma sp. (ex Biomphalaria glabrata) TaxID=1749074 RepID=UPI001F02F824|nr:CTP synthase [Mycoplasma sp. (ex Biomphalaria glabrata)]
MMNSKQNQKYVFVIGGVVSSLGKGIVSSCLGALLKARGISIFNKKCDPYLNIDPGTMNPYQHGEVFVTKDGGETDLDLGHYERFTSVELTKNSNITAGRIYYDVLIKERKGTFLGKTIQVVPHITDEIKNNIYRTAEESKSEVLIVEFGGTVGDIEIYPFVEVARQIYLEKGRENVMFIFVTLVPKIRVNNEIKTKPTQFAVKELGRIGIQPDILVLRCEEDLENEVLEKISMFCNVQTNCVMKAIDVDNIYKIPIYLHNQEFDQRVIERLGLLNNPIKLDNWYSLINKIENLNKEITIGLVGKYIELEDAYKSVIESAKIAGFHNLAKVKIKMINARKLNNSNIQEQFRNVDGVIIPGGFGYEGVEGKILAIKYTRENNVPMLGICLGMQLALVEFARNILNYETANSTEFDPETDHPIVHIIRGKSEQDEKGGTLRLGNYNCELKNNSLAYECYGQKIIQERHRHRYEVNSKYIKEFEKHGMIFSGINPDNHLCEIVELENHPFFIASQYHPEFKNNLTNPNPLFIGLVKASLKMKYKN